MASLTRCGPLPRVPPTRSARPERLPASVAQRSKTSTLTLSTMGIIFSIVIRLLTSPTAQALATAEAFLSLRERVRGRIRAFVQSDWIVAARRARDRCVISRMFFPSLSNLTQCALCDKCMYVRRFDTEKRLICLSQRILDIVRAIREFFRTLVTKPGELHSTVLIR